MKSARTLAGFLTLVAAIALAGCAAQTSVQDGHELKPGQGFIAMRMDATTDFSLFGGTLSYVAFSKESTFASRFSEGMLGPKGAVRIEKGTRYWVLPEDQGEYMWSRFTINNQFANLHSSNRFTVKPNTITYIGHISLTAQRLRLSIRVHDDEADMRRHIETRFPALLKSHGFEKQIVQMGLRQ